MRIHFLLAAARSHIRLISVLVVALVFFVTSVNSVRVLALNPAQKALYGQDVPYFELASCSALNSPESQTASPEPSGLQSILQQAVNENRDGSTAIAVAPLNSQDITQINGDSPVAARASYHLYIAVAVARAVDLGTFSWSSVENDMKKMMVKSETPAANRLRDKVGVDKINLMLQGASLSSNTSVLPGDQGVNSKSTAVDFVTFLRKLHDGTIAGLEEEGKDRVLELMKDNDHRRGIATRLPDDIDVANKAGWAGGATDPATNDVGLVYAKGKPYAVAILMSNGDSNDQYSKNDWASIAGVNLNIYRSVTSKPIDAAGNVSRTSRSVYVVGDSITLGAKDALANEFRSQNIESTINASVSRSITKPGTTSGNTTSGLDALDADAATWKDAGAVVIALGTNQRDGNFGNAIDQMIDKVKDQTSGNPDAKIYWVNVFSPGVSDRSSINSKIKDRSSTKGFSVIDTTGQNIGVGSDRLHPTSSGSGEFARVVAGAVDIPVTSEANDLGSNCVCGNGAGGAGEAASGASTAETKPAIYDFLVGTGGLKPYQAAGIMGNMKHESGYNPMQLQGRPIGEKTKAATLGSRNTGWGLVQWTPASKFISTQSPVEKAEDLNVQLQFLLDQLNGKGPLPEKQAGDDVKASVDVQDAVIAFQGTNAGGPYKYYFGYERPADKSGSVPSRTQEARAVLSQFGSRTVSNTSSGDATTCITDGSGEVIGEYSLPVAKKWYEQHKDWFTKPHHDYPSADIPVPTGTKIFAVAGGKVSSAGENGGAGTSVFIKSPDGRTEYGYFHGTPGSIKVKVNQEVSPGDLLMLSDNTGNSTGPHLHFQIKINGIQRCPQGLLQAIGDGTSVPDLSDLAGTGCTN